MADEPKKDQPEDIKSILTDLDAILTGSGGAAKAAPKPAEPPPAPPKPEAPAAKPEPPKANQPPSIELAPREGLIKPPEKKPEPPKPAAKLPEQKSMEFPAGPAPTAPADAPKASMKSPPPKLPEKANPDLPKAPPAPTAAPAPAPVVPSTPIEELPADTPKEQIRRVAYVYTGSCSGVKTALAAFLSQAARTISKKPLYLREVLSHEVSAKSDPRAVLRTAQQAKAAAILAVVEDWPQAKVDELSEACSSANMLFRAVAPGDAQKKSTAVDIIVDMMLLPGEG